MSCRRVVGLLPRTHHFLLIVLVVLAGACAPAPEGGFDAAGYYQSNCLTCHGAATGGTISDLPPVHNANGHTWHHGDCLLADTIRRGAPRRPGLPADIPTMPPFDLSDVEVAALIDHMRMWWTPAQIADQAATTTASC